MDLKKAQQLIGQMAENPASLTPGDRYLLLEALCTIIVRNGLLAKNP